ncbi:MAG: hypothetical protein HY955_02475 [Deltaproteobacteria bacterium]|nr:hypothetical protein [Deltaproteobacteria bacterium]
MEKHKATIKRCLNEVGIAMMEWKVLKGMENSKGWTSVGGFFHIANIAIYNDMMARMIKVLDDDARSSTFMSIKKSEEKFISANASSGDIELIESMKTKIKTIRTKTHFHIDKHYVSNPQEVWSDADIKTDEFFQVIELVFNILNKLHYFYFKTDFPFSSYDGKDATWIINLVNKEEGWE